MATFNINLGDGLDPNIFYDFSNGENDIINVFVPRDYNGSINAGGGLNSDTFNTTEAGDTINFTFGMPDPGSGISDFPEVLLLTGSNGQPDILVWDEPFDGTAPPGQDASRQFIQLGQTSSQPQDLSETWPGTVNICFTRDTMIDTDQGAVAVQDLSAGMMVRTRDNGMQPIRWVGMSPTRDRAVRIKAGAMGNDRDLVVSPRHRMVLDGWQLEMLFDHDHALVTALELVNDDTIVRDEMADVEYYHVMFDRHEIIFAEGAATESFHPDQPSMGSMDQAAREEIFALFPELAKGETRAEAAPNLTTVQSAYVGKNLDAFLN